MGKAERRRRRLGYRLSSATSLQSISIHTSPLVNVPFSIPLIADILSFPLLERGSGRMPDWQSRQPGFEPPFTTVSKFEHFRSLNVAPSSLSCINEYMAIDGGVNVIDWSSRVILRGYNASQQSRVGVGMNRFDAGGDSVNRFERSSGLDTALYKNIPFFSLSFVFLPTPPISPYLYSQSFLYLP